MPKKFSYYIIQGSDFKARNWMAPFGKKARFFSTARELINLLRLSGDKCLIFRYMNSDKSLSTDIKYTLLVVLICTFRFFFRIRIYWVLHNIDAETVDLFPWLTRIRRCSLMWASTKVFLTDAFFKERFFSANNKVEAISFGPKLDGDVSSKNLKQIIRLKKKYDLVALCLGAPGDKYVHFERLTMLSKYAADNGLSIAFILPKHTSPPGIHCLHIDELNIDEKIIAPYVNFIYRINNDLSMPYTIYAACDAKIPIVTAKGFFTFDIIENYGIGFDEIGFFSANQHNIEEVKSNMGRFMERSDWGSLSKKIIGPSSG